MVEDDSDQNQQNNISVISIKQSKHSPSTPYKLTNEKKPKEFQSTEEKKKKLFLNVHFSILRTLRKFQCSIHIYTSYTNLINFVEKEIE